MRLVVDIFEESASRCRRPRVNPADVLATHRADPAEEHARPGDSPAGAAAVLADLGQDVADGDLAVEQAASDADLGMGGVDEAAGAGPRDVAMVDRYAGLVLNVGRVAPATLGDLVGAQKMLTSVALRMSLISLPMR